MERECECKLFKGNEQCFGIRTGESFAEFATTQRVAIAVETGRESTDAADVWNDYEQTSTDATLARKTHRESEIAAVVIHSCGDHDGEGIADSAAREDALVRDGAHASIREASCDRGHRLRVLHD